jgi:hypothetical protein
MGHYYSEMRSLKPHERLEDFLTDNKGGSLTIRSESGEEITFTWNDIEQILRERSAALGEIIKIKALFRKLSK